MASFTEKSILQSAAGVTIVAAASSLLAFLALHLFMLIKIHATISNFFGLYFPLLSMLVLLAVGISLLPLGAHNTVRSKSRIVTVLILIHSLMIAVNYIIGIIAWARSMTENPKALAFMISNGVLLVGYLAIIVWIVSLLFSKKHDDVFVRISAWVVVVTAGFRLFASIYGSFLYWSDVDVSSNAIFVMALDLLQIPCGIITILAQLTWIYIFYPRKKSQTGGHTYIAMQPPPPMPPSC